MFTTSFMGSIQLFSVLRMFMANVRGKAAKVVSSVFSVNFWQQESCDVYGNGEQTRDFVYAGDVAAAIKAGLAARGYQTINVSTEHETSVNQLLGAFAEVAADNLKFVMRNRDRVISFVLRCLMHV